MQYLIYFSLFETFSHLRNFKECVQRTVRVSTWIGDQIRIPRVVMTSFSFFSPSFSKAILRTAKLPSLCNAVSSIYKLIVLHFAMAVFYVYLLALCTSQIEA